MKRTLRKVGPWIGGILSAFLAGWLLIMAGSKESDVRGIATYGPMLIPAKVWKDEDALWAAAVGRMGELPTSFPSREDVERTLTLEGVDASQRPAIVGEVWLLMVTHASKVSGDFERSRPEQLWRGLFGLPRGYWKMSIVNEGRPTATAVWIEVPGARYATIDRRGQSPDSEEPKVAEVGPRIELGDLRQQESVSVTVWCTSEPSRFTDVRLGHSQGAGELDIQHPITGWWFNLSKNWQFYMVYGVVGVLFVLFQVRIWRWRRAGGGAAGAQVPESAAKSESGEVNR